MSFAWLVFVLLSAIPAIWLLRRGRSGTLSRVLALALVSLAAVTTTVRSLRTERTVKSQDELHRSIPREGRPDGYISSDTCQSCHPTEYATWHQTFHRTMTQVASRESMVANFENVTLELHGKRFQLERRGDEYWVDMEDPEWKPSPQTPLAPRVQRRIGLLTGSHHMQVYWVPSQSGNMQNIFPFAWLIGDQRWAPFHSTFLRDPAIAPTTHIWNVNCINCHSTGGQPRPDAKSRTLDTRAGELGIACEACHSTAQEHVRANQSPLRRYRFHSDETPDGTIVNPERLTAQVSSQICGQCHGIKWIPNREDWSQNGFRYRPGDELNQTTPVVRPAKLESQTWLAEPLKRNPRFIGEHYWSDGMVRVSGREYNGLVESPCHERGELSCLSCHSMHKCQQPEDQLKLRMDTNQACLQCHPSIQTTEHTRHLPDSSGSQCYNCHMPHTTYGLLKAIRSHQIDRPDLKRSQETGRPNACNLCHLDKTLAWTSKHLTDWYGHKPIELNSDERQIAAAVLWLLKGDAGQRALLAWSMGWPAARAASGQEWLAPFLAELLTDPYSAVRYIAFRSLAAISDDYRKLNYDFVGSPDERASAKRRAVEIWMKTEAGRLDRAGGEILIEPGGTLKHDIIQRLLQQRNNRSMDLQE